MTHTAEPVRNDQPAWTFRRVGLAFALMVALGVASLAVFPPLVLILLFLSGPPLLGLFFSGADRDRNSFSMYGTAAAAGGALSGSIWVATHPGGAHPMAVIVSIFATFVVMGVLGALAVWLASFTVKSPDSETETHD
jgi:apolipoprotein N-acyltransferase